MPGLMFSSTAKHGFASWQPAGLRRDAVLPGFQDGKADTGFKAEWQATASPAIPRGMQDRRGIAKLNSDGELQGEVFSEKKHNKINEQDKFL